MLNVELMLELKDALRFKKEKHIIIDNLKKRIDNYQNLFTNMKDNNMIDLNEPSKVINKESNKRKKSHDEIITRCVGNNIKTIKFKKEASIFCSFSGHIASSYATKTNIGIIIDRNELVELL